MRYIFFLSILLAAAGCTMHPTVKVKVDSLVVTQKIPDTLRKVNTDTPKINETITPGYGFKIVKRVKFFDDKKDVKQYLEKYLEIWHNGHRLFRDTTDSAAQYKLESEFYPVVRQIKPMVFEIVLGQTNEPFKDFALLFRIENDIIVRREEIPDFDNKPEWINGLETYHDVFIDGEAIPHNNEAYSPYNPELYYQVTRDGLKLDSGITMVKNIKRYGRFEGFGLNENIGYRKIDDDHFDTVAKHVLRLNDY